ncbi:MAG: RNA-binding S4 domain-containing protein [Ornithinibacter sp.]
MNTGALDVPIRDESIRLGQLLKLAGLVDDGGVAREVIERGLVAVNGDIETRRGRQVRPGDVVTLEDQTLRVLADGGSG